MTLARSDLHCVGLGRDILLLTLIILYVPGIALCAAVPTSSTAPTNEPDSWPNIPSPTGTFHCVNNVNWTGGGLVQDDCHYAILGVSLFEVLLQLKSHGHKPRMRAVCIGDGIHSKTIARENLNTKLTNSSIAKFSISEIMPINL